jgi:hypothetical protein
MHNRYEYITDIGKADNNISGVALDDTIHELNSSDKNGYWVKPMDEKAFRNTCSEFFWETQNMDKGLKRDELSFAMFIRDILLTTGRMSRTCRPCIC